MLVTYVKTAAIFKLQPIFPVESIFEHDKQLSYFFKTIILQK